MADEAHLSPEGEESPYHGVVVRLDAFDGPLDLLLHLIQKDEIDISDIPIARITQQYLDHIDLMHELDLEVAGEYMVMAATLIRIKSQMLLPTPDLDEEGEEVDPRDELVRRLVEYRKFKAVAEELHTREQERARRHGRVVELPDLEPDELPLGNVTVFDLVSVLKRMVDNLREETFHDVELEPIQLEDRIEILRARLAASPELTFVDFLGDMTTRMGIIVSFMALLELLKLGEARCVQHEIYGEIVIQRRDGGAESYA